MLETRGKYSKENKAEERRAELQAVAQAAADEVRSQVRGIVREIAGDQPEAIQQTIAMYLHQVPVAIHQSLRRPADPTGTTLPPILVVRSPEELLPFLPVNLPRFKPGDRPLLGVDWELVELLGVGGFGEVWKARNPHFDSVPPVALKFCLDPSAKERLLRHEAAVLNQVMRQGRHPGIVPLRHTYLSADPPCLEYQYIEGGDLTGLVAHRPPESRALPPKVAAKIILRLAKIIGYAHRLTPPIVHRDLKPANILLEKAPDNKLAIRVADFGIGGLAAGRDIDQTKQGLRPGALTAAAVRGAYTALYASPQQMRGMPADPRDDVHALGVIWYQLLIGDLGVGRPGGRGWRNRLTDRGMATPLIDLLESCFEDHPDDRPIDAVAVAEELNRRLATEHQRHPEALINPVYAKDDNGNRYPTQLPDSLPGVISQLNDSYDEEGAKSVIEQYGGSSADIANAYDYRARGEFYLRGGEYGKAIADYTEAIGLDSNKASAHCGRGEAYAQMGEYERAIADYREAIRLDPASAYAHALKGRVYFQTGDYEQAIADFSEAIRLDPTDAYAHGIRGWACRLQGYLITAINDLTEALRIDPTLGWAEEQLSLARGERR